MRALKFVSGIVLSGAIAAGMSTASALPITQTFNSATSTELGYTVSWTSTFPGLVLVPTQPITYMSLPGFDSSLGTLLSADLRVEGYLASSVTDHAGSPTGSALFEHDFAVRTNLHQTIGGLDEMFASSQDASFGSLQRYNMNHTYHDSGFDAALFNPFVESMASSTSAAVFNQIYTGSDLALFIDNPGFGFGDNSLTRYLTAGGSHTSDPLLSEIFAGQLFSFPTEIQPGQTPPDLLDAVVATAQILALLNEQEDHGAFYSHMHIAASARYGMQVAYTYEPVPVPEPGTLALLGLGLASFGFARRSSRKVDA